MLRIVQIIDSLDAGGAERMAVNYANTLSTTIDFSGLVASRSEGLLKETISPHVAYTCLNKKHTFDIGALAKLYKFCKLNNIHIAHAHSTSYFIAFLLKCLLPRIKIIWHDHYGMSDRLALRSKFPLTLISTFFSGIISVNSKLLEWAQTNLSCKNAIFLPNFVVEPVKSTTTISLRGTAGKRILCLANLRPQKNHMLLIPIAGKLKESHPDWTFHLVGKDFHDAASEQLKSAIKSAKLSEYVYLYGSQQDTGGILAQCDISILTSISEGLPVSLLESGMARKAVVVTAVGEIPDTIQNGKNGYVVASEDPDAFYNALVELIDDEKLRIEMGTELFETVRQGFSGSAVAKSYLDWVAKTIV